MTPAPYHYKVVSTNGSGVSASSVDSTFTTVSHPAISNILVINITGNSATVTWTTDQPATSQVDYGETTAYGQTVQASTPVTSHSITLTGLIFGTSYHFRVVSTNSDGLTSSSADNTFAALNLISITITSPIDGETVSRPEVMVQGTVTSVGGNETGVVVNGILAIVHGDQFVANHVPLQEGENTITVTATDTAGNTAEASVTVTLQPVVDYVKITADQQSGVSPLEATLSVEGSFDFTESSVSYSGTGSVEFLESGAYEYRIRMTATGIYYFTAEVTDAENNVHTDTVAIEVIDQAQLDQLLKAKWNGMKTALIAGDVEGALNYYQEDTQDKYAAIYNALGSDLPMLAQQMQEISPIYFEESRAKYRIRQDHDVEGQTVTIAYYIYFSQDENGIWKIEKY